MGMSHKRCVEIFKGLCDENRVRILKSLQEGEKCGCTLLDEMVIAQSTLSHHMKILVESGLVEFRRDGKWTYYSLSDDGAREAMQVLESMLHKVENYETVCVCER